MAKVNGKIRNSDKIVEGILGRNMAQLFLITSRIALTSGVPTFSLIYCANAGAAQIKLVWDSPLSEIKKMLAEFKETNNLSYFSVIKYLTEELAKPFTFRPQRLVAHTMGEGGNTLFHSEAEYQGAKVWAWYCAEDETWFVEPKGLGHNWEEGHWREVEREEVELLS